MAEETPDDRARVELARFLLGPALAGLAPALRERALAAVLGSAPVPDAPSREVMLRRLAAFGAEETRAVVQKLRHLECDDAVRAHALRAAGQPLPEALAQALSGLPLDVPIGLPTPLARDHRLGQALSLLADVAFLERWTGDAPESRRIVEQALAEAVTALGERAPEAVAAPVVLIDRLLSAGGLPEAVEAWLREARAAAAVSEARQRASVAARIAGGDTAPWAKVDERIALDVVADGWSSADEAERRRRLDILLRWPTSRVLPRLAELCSETWAQDRAMPVLSLRYGHKLGADWTQWSAWLRRQTPAADAGLDPTITAAVDPAEVLVLAARMAGPAWPEPSASVRDWCRDRTFRVTPAQFLERWRDRLPPLEARVLAPVVTPPAPVLTPPPVVRAPAEMPPVRPAPTPPPPPPPPPDPVAIAAAQAWRGFLAENANLLAGIAMLLVGASLVAYFTWDRHWIFRYTIVPGLFGGFTAGLAAVARWLERSDEKLQGTAAMLRGAAIALLPANCMSVSLLAEDPLVTAKLLTVPVMAGFYLVLLVLGLRRWCGDVHPTLRGALAPGLVFLNALVLVRPLARSLPHAGELATLSALTAGFYAGFLVIAAVAHRFVTRTLSKELAERPHVAWFTGGILALTYVQVFIWVHAWQRQLPPVAAYGPLLVLAGGLVFYVERRFRVGLGSDADAGEESFVGFALILLGLLAGFGHPYGRILCFAVAGLLWLYQAAFRRDAIHDYIGLLLLVLGGASVGLLDAFPKPALAAIGVVVCGGLGMTAVVAGRLDVARLRRSAVELEQALLALTAIVAGLAQWHFHSEPLYTAAILVVVGARLLARAVRYERPRDGLIAAMVLALALPYLGFADMRGHAFAGNTLVMGLACLSILWLAGLRLANSQSLTDMRSTAIFIYGAFALGAMAARVLLERQFEPSLSWSVSFPEYAGPLLMLGVLVYTTYLSRSMLPMIGGMLIVVVFLPAMKADFQAMFPALSWGTGYGSAVTALLLAVLAFYVRGLPSLRGLGDGDRFFGETAFPWARHDHRVITTPLVATVLFLAVRVDGWSVLRNLAQGPPLKTAAAVLITAAVWTLLGVWARERAVGPWAVRLAFPVLLAGLVLGQRQWGGSTGLEWSILLAGVVLQAAETAYRAVVAPRHPWADALLVRPTATVLHWGSAVVSVGLVAALVIGYDATRLRWLAAFVAIQLVRRAIRDRGFVEGALTVALVLVCLLAETAPGQGFLLARLSWEHSLWPVLGFISAIALVTLALERTPWFDTLLALLDPARAAAALLLVGLTVLAMTTAVIEPHVSRSQQWVLAANLALLARWALPGPLWLLALVQAYFALLAPTLTGAHGEEARLRVLTAPVSLAWLALVVALAAVTRPAWEGLASGALRSPQAIPVLQTRVAPWLEVPAVLFAAAATLRHSLEPALRAEARELMGPYIAGVALVLLAISLESGIVAWMGAAAVTLGNVHAVRIAAGDTLAAHGFSELHLVALGVAATMLQSAMARRVSPAGPARDRLEQVTLAAAALVLTLLGGNFAADPNLQDITPHRFIVSGAMALAAGLSFRRAAVRPEPDEVPYVGLAYAVYHLGVAMALWCLVLLVPVFRQPIVALPGLALPALYFYVAAERFRREGDARERHYGRSAAVIAITVLALYAARPLFQMALFPDAVVRTNHYHYNAPLVMALGVLLLRLHAFESRFAVAWTGGAALMVGTYFGVTSWPGLSPFEVRFPAAWAGVAIAHAFAGLSVWAGVHRRWLQALGSIDDPTWERLAAAWHLTAFVGALEVAFIAAVHADAWRFGWGALLGGTAAVLLWRSWWRPAMTMATAALLAFGVAEAVRRPSWLSEIGLLVVALAAARLAPGAFALIVWCTTYVIVHHAEPEGLTRLEAMTSPWRLAALALGMAVTVEIARRRPAWFDTAPADGWVEGRSMRHWLGVPGAVLAVVASALHTRQDIGAGRGPSAQLATSYLASATHAMLALSLGGGVLAWSAAALLALANIHVIHTFFGPALAAHGVSEMHEIALGLTGMIAVLWPLRLAAWSGEGARRQQNVRAAGAAAVVLCLAAHYVIVPGLAGFGHWRAAASGAMALLAAEAFRARARRGDGSSSSTDEGLYHAALAVGLWSLALVVPALRTPALSLVTLSLPVVYFWARTEVWASLGDSVAARYRASAVATSALVLLLYASRWMFAAALFPGEVPATRHYHVHALLVLGLGFLLVRLHGLGAPHAVALAGALAVLVGSYFGVTAWPGLSPFDHPLEASWAAVVLVHLWTLATIPSSSLSAIVRGFGGLDDAQWGRLRAAVGKAALLGLHVVAVAAIADGKTDTRAIAPLLWGTASVLLHHGLVRRSAVYFDLAAIEGLIALHADLVVPSDVPLARVVWVLLALRAVLLLVRSRVPAAAVSRVDVWGAVASLLVVAHVFHHRPWSTAGLVATGLLATITALVPRRRATAATFAERLVVRVLLLTPTWLVHFASARWDTLGPLAPFHAEPLLRTALAVLLTGAAAIVVPLWLGTRTATVGTPRAAHQLRRYLETSGETVFAAALYMSSLVGAALLVLHYDRPYTNRALILFVLLLVGMAAGWYRSGRRRRSWVECFAAEVCGVSALALLRRQLLLTTSFWTHEYDLWASLASSAILTGLKQRLDRRPGADELKRPVTLSILLMPALGLFWAVSHHLGSDMVLLVIGLNSVLFAFLGRERRDSPYNLVAVTGFVAFVVLVFWSRLELRVLHAYVVPVGLGVLLLVQLFEKDLRPAACDRIRFVTLVLMLASAGYHALLDPRHPVAFNLALLLLCVACLAVGTVLRIRLYVALGFAVLLVDLASLAVKALIRMESNARMTWVGAAVFLLGAAVVALGVLHKARRDEIEEILARWRARLGLGSE